MLDIRIEGVSAELQPNAQLVLERFNPMFDFTTVPGTKVMDFQLPDTPQNRRLFGHPGHEQAPSPKRRWLCEKYLNTALIETGYVKLSEVSSVYKCYFTQNLGQIFGDYQDRLLSEITEFGTSVVSSGWQTEPLNYGFLPIHNPSFFGNAAPEGWNGILNDAAYDVPFLFVGRVLAKFGTLTGWTFTGEFWDSSFFKRLMFYNLYALDGAGSLSWVNHLPDLTVGGLLIQLRNLFNLYLDFDVRRKICRLDLADSVLSADRVLDWTSKGVPNGIKTPDTNARLELGYEIDGNDALMKPVPPAMDVYRTPETADTEGATLRPIRSKFSTLTRSAASRYETDQVGYSKRNKDSNPTPTFRLVLWPDNRGGVPLTTNGVGERTLEWAGADGLAARFWKGFEGFMASTVRVQRNFTLTPGDLATFSFRNKIHYRGANYMVASLKANLTNEDAILCDVELYKL